MIPASAARRASVSARTAACRQPDWPHPQVPAGPPTGRWATDPAADRGPWCTTPPAANAASTTLPTNRCTTLVRLRRSPKSCSALISARAWPSIRAGRPASSCSRSRTGTSRQPSAGWSTSTPAAGSTQPPAATPSPSGARRAVSDEGGESRRDSPQHLRRALAAMRVRFPCDDPAAQVHHAQRARPRANVQAADDVPVTADVDGHMGPADAVGAVRPGDVTDQASLSQVSAVTADHGRAQPGQAGDGAAGHGAVIEHREQHIAVARRAPPVGRAGNVRPAQAPARARRTRTAGDRRALTAARASRRHPARNAATSRIMHA